MQDGLDLVSMPLQRDAHQLTSGPDTGLIEEALQRRFNCALGDLQAICNLLVGQTFKDKRYFDGGTLLHRERAAKAGYTQASEQYRSTVLTAFQNVADALNALQQDADALKATAAAKDAAGVTLDLSRKQFQSGYVNYLALLSAEQTYQQTVLNLAQAQANRYADTAALFLALGGGWWNRADIPKN